MEEIKVGKIFKYRIDTMYVNQLLSLQQMYAATEQYERAAQVQKLIELEVKLQKERHDEM